MSMSTGSAGRTSVKSEPNVVPMIDIMLVLLIIFMIVTPLIAAGFKAELPKAKNLYATRDDKILFFKADQKLKYGRVQQGIEIARKAGARVVRSITERNEAASLLGGKKKGGG